MSEVSPRLTPLIELSEDKVLEVWLECFQRHYEIWMKGIVHGDISVWNLMYDKDNDCGVISDWDIHINNKTEMDGGERTETLIFMAGDLLENMIPPEDGFPRKLVHRQYRHEVESFMWVLVYVGWVNLLKMKTRPWTHGSEEHRLFLQLSQSFNLWRTGSPMEVKNSKYSFLILYRKKAKLGSLGKIWEKSALLINLLFWIDGCYSGDCDKPPDSARLHEAVVKIMKGDVDTPREVDILALNLN